MKYVCLIYIDEKRLAAIPRGDLEVFVGEALAYREDLRQKGYFLTAQDLQGVQAATAVRVRNGRVFTTEGPAADAQEQLRGFILIDARDLNEAIQVASKMPEARVGSIEVRPVRESDQTDRWSLHG